MRVWHVFVTSWTGFRPVHWSEDWQAPPFPACCRDCVHCHWRETIKVEETADDVVTMMWCVRCYERLPSFGRFEEKQKWNDFAWEIIFSLGLIWHDWWWFPWKLLHHFCFVQRQSQTLNFLMWKWNKNYETCLIVFFLISLIGLCVWEVQMCEMTNLKNFFLFTHTHTHKKKNPSAPPPFTKFLLVLHSDV